MTSKKQEAGPWTVLVDTREQTPYTFAGIQDRQGREIVTERVTLPVGDYGIRINDRPLPIAIERKTKTDLYGSLGKGRDRFKREMERGVKLKLFVVLMVEDTVEGLLIRPPYSTGMDPVKVVRTLLSWSIRYNLHAMPLGSRRICERCTYRLLAFFARQYIKEK